MRCKPRDSSARYVAPGASRAWSVSIWLQLGGVHWRQYLGVQLVAAQQLSVQCNDDRGQRHQYCRGGWWKIEADGNERTRGKWYRDHIVGGRPHEVLHHFPVGGL